MSLMLRGFGILLLIGLMFLSRILFIIIGIVLLIIIIRLIADFFWWGKDKGHW